MNRQKIIIHKNGRHRFDVEKAFREVKRAYFPFWYLDPIVVTNNFEPRLVSYYDNRKGLDLDMLENGYGDVINAYSLPEVDDHEVNASGWYHSRYWTIQNFAEKKDIWVNVMVHELSHHFSRVMKKPDRTHEYHKRANDPLDRLKDGIDSYLFEGWPREALVVHHSGRKRGSNETLDGIESYHKKKYGSTWYNAMIGHGVRRVYDSTRHQRGDCHSYDVMVQGDYRSDKLSMLDYWLLDKEIQKRRTVVGHKELVDMGYAEPTACPGDLLEEYMRYRDEAIPKYIKLLRRYRNLLKRALEAKKAVE